MSHVTEKEALLNLAVTKQREVIRHEFSNEEMATMKDQISTNLIKLSDLDREFDEVKEGFKSKMKPLEKENQRLLVDIRLGFRDEEKLVNLVPDYDNRIMELYDDEGTKVGERKMLMSEFQAQKLR